MNSLNRNTILKYKKQYSIGNYINFVALTKNISRITMNAIKPKRPENNQIEISQEND